MSFGGASSITSNSATAPVVQALTPGVRGISITARNSDGFIGFADGNNPTAGAVVHYIAAGERLDIDLSSFSAPRVGVLYGPAGAPAIFNISEMT